MKKLLATLLSLALLLGLAAMPVVAETQPVRFTWMLSENADLPLTTDVLSVQTIKDQLGVEIEIMAVPESDYETRLSVLLGTNQLPDAFTVNASILQQYAGTGMFLNLSDYADQMPDYLALAEGDRAANTATYKYEGDIYGFQTYEDYRIGIAPLVVLRVDLLEKLGLETPTTWEEFYDAMLAIKGEYPYSYIFSARNGTKYLLGNIAYSMGAGGFGATQQEAGVYFEPTTGKWTYGPAAPAYKEAVAYLARAYADELLHPDYAIMDRTMMTANLTSENLFAVIDNTTFSNDYNKAIREINPDAYFDMIDPLAHGDTPARAITFARDWEIFTVINANCENPEALVAFFNWLYTPEGEMLTNYGVEGVTFAYDENGQPKLLDEIADGANYAALRAQYGLGTFYIAKHVNEKPNMDIMMLQAEKTGVMPVNISQSERVAALRSDGVLVNRPAFPNFTHDEANELATLETRLNTMFEQEIDRFVTGARSMDEWESFVETLRAQGVDRVEEIYNTAYAR